MGTHPIFESDFDCLTECCPVPSVSLPLNAHPPLWFWPRSTPLVNFKELLTQLLPLPLNLAVMSRCSLPLKTPQPPQLKSLVLPVSLPSWPLPVLSTRVALPST